jgi:geranylgeranyl diphosphate synthase type II
MEVSSDKQKHDLKELSSRGDENKIEEVLHIYKSCKIDGWAKELKHKYFSRAMDHLEEIAVLSARKKPLEELAANLMERDM